MSRPVIASLAAGLAICTAANPSFAQQANEDWQTIDVLTAMVASALGRTATPVDRRIKLARCPEPATVTAIDANALAVRCVPLGWRLRVAMTAGADGALPVAHARNGAYASPADTAEDGDEIAFLPPLGGG